MSAPTFEDVDEDLEFSSPAPEPMGKVPDHEASVDDFAPTDLPFRSDPLPDSKPNPWDRITGRKAKAPKPPKGAREPVASLPRNFESQLKDMYVTVGTMLLPFDRTCGNAIIMSADKCAKSLVDYAKTNADVRRVLLRLVGTSAVGAIIAAHTPIIMVVAAHHVGPIMSRNMNAADPGPVTGENEPSPEPSRGNTYPFPVAGAN